MAVLLKGSEVVNAMKDKLLDSVEKLRKQGIVPGLAIVRLGAKPDDLSYERGIIKRCEGLGIKCSVYEFDEQITQNDLIREIENLNNNEEVHGILIFRPLPRHIDENVVKYAISPEKDVDCLSPINLAKVFEGNSSGFAPCTPEAVVEILEHYGISVEGKKVVIIGRSLVVGRPLSMMLLKKNATVTICHTRTRNIEEVCKEAEILIAAAGKAKMVNDSFISEGQTVIDVGINVDENGKLCGDVDFDEAEKRVAYITPVPGGVGTVTTSILAKHVVQAAMKKCAED